MFRAFLFNALGGTFEVRLINMKSGKDVPGTKLYKGGYFKARQVARDKHLKDGQMIRLQVVAVLDYRANDAFAAANLARDVMNPPEQGIMDQPELPADLGKPVYDIGESNARQSEFMHEHQDEPNVYTGTDPDDHDCDTLGPQDWSENDSQYHMTCSVCGLLR